MNACSTWRGVVALNAAPRLQQNALAQLVSRGGSGGC
jgi:hypothetical protein